MDKMMADIGRLLESQGFEDIDEANAFLQQMMASGEPIPSASPRSPLEEAQELMSQGKVSHKWIERFGRMPDHESRLPVSKPPMVERKCVTSSSVNVFNWAIAIDQIDDGIGDDSVGMGNGGDRLRGTSGHGCAILPAGFSHPVFTRHLLQMGSPIVLH